jgi:hypothetical protein
MTYQSALPAAGVRGRQKKLTPERIQQTKLLVQSGVSCEDIATSVGVTVGTLKVSCSKLGISLRRPRPTSRNGWPPSKAAMATKMVSLSAAKFTVVVRCHGEGRATDLPLTAAMIGRLALEASSRGLSITELAGELVAAVAKRGLVQRVLEE